MSRALENIGTSRDRQEIEFFKPKKVLQRSNPRFSRSNMDKENHDDITHTPESKRMIPNTTPTMGEGLCSSQPRKVQDSCFTPRHSLRRSPTSTSRQHVETPMVPFNNRDDDGGAGRPISQRTQPTTRGRTLELDEDIVHSTKQVPRPNKKRLRGDGDESDNPKQELHSQAKRRRGEGKDGRDLDGKKVQSQAKRRRVHREGDRDVVVKRTAPQSGHPKQVQASCFSPRKCLKRSPVQQVGSMQTQLDCPPATHWELPRTPISVHSHPPHEDKGHPLPHTTTPQKDDGHFSSSQNEAPTSYWELPCTPPQKTKGHSSTNQRELLRTPPPETKGHPPTSHWELPCTPPQKTKDHPSTNQRELLHTPPPEGKPTSHWELPRTPPQEIMGHPSTDQRELLGTPPPERKGHRDPSTSHWELPRAPPQITKDRPPTNQRELLHTPPQKTKGHPPTNQKELPPQSDTAPPTSHWELPRTPIHTECVQLEFKSGQVSPGRTKAPRHPLSLSHSFQALPVPAAEPHPATASHNPVITEPQNQEIRREEQASSPPIVLSNGVGSVPGIQYTAEDLAFLQRMKNVKQYKIFETQAELLSKEEKAVTEEIEQLEHTSLKVQKDLNSMKAKYQEIVSSISTLIADRDLLSSENSGHHLEISSTCHKYLSQADITQVKKVNQLTSSQVEKVDKKIKEKLKELDLTKHQLQEKIRECEDRNEQRRMEMEARTEALMDEKILLERKIEAVVGENSCTEAEVESLQLELTKLKRSQRTATAPRKPAVQSSSASDPFIDKQRAEERLKKIIKRCELYIQRHKLLKKMGIKH